MEGVNLAVPLIISEESSLASALHFLAESGDDRFPKCGYEALWRACAFIGNIWIWYYIFSLFVRKKSDENDLVYKMHKNRAFFFLHVVQFTFI